MRFFTRHFAGTLLVVVLALGTLLLLGEASLRREIEHEVLANLQREVRLAERLLPGDSGTWQEAVDRYHQATGHRFTLIDSTGRVRAESDVQPTTVPAIENHLDRPEIQAALREGYGSDRRLSRTLGQIQLYVAVRAGPGVLRASTALSQVDRILGGSRRSLTSAAVLALLVAAVVSLLASRHLTRPIAVITEAARAIASGEPPHLPHSNIPDIDALIRAIRDMHEQLERRFEELRAERGEGAALVEAMIEGVIAADARGRIVTANAAARRLLGYGPTDILPNLDQVFRPKPARVAVQEVLAGESVTERQVELDAATVLLSGRSLPGDGTLLVLHDVTALRRLETVRRDFVANVSHELKTPLTSISGYAETLSQELPDPDTTRRFLGVILGNARRMQRLVDGLLDLSRIESGGWRPAPERLDTAAVAQETWHLVKDRLGTRPAELVTEIANGAETIWSDPDAYRQVLTNLLENALRYTPPGGRIWLRARPEDQGVLVSVRDEGPGIAGEHLPRIFERFYRADAGRSREEGGTGLGLAIVRHLVDAHGGWVHAESALGSGSEFSCWFPAPKRDPDEVLMPA